MRTRVIGLLLAGAVILSAAWILLRDRGTDHPVARITRDGALVEEIDLSRVEEPYTLALEDEGGSNRVLVEPGRIRVIEASCPDQVCVNQGYISDSTAPIICLPNKVMIEIVGGGGGLDGAAG